MADDDKWPAPQYDPGRPKHYHAIGVFSLSFAQFQASLENLYMATATKRGMPRELAGFFFANLTEDKRVVAIELLFNTVEWKYDADVVESVGNLLKCFNWARDCRNTILHAEQYPASMWGRKELLHLVKKTKSRENIYAKFDLEALRAIADKTREGVLQSAAIALHLRVRGTDPKDIPETYKPFQSLPPLLKIPKVLRLSKTP